MDVLTEQLDSSVQLPVSDATRERRDPLTLGLLPEAERRVCEAVGPGPPALAGGPPLFARGLRHRCVPHRRGAYRARDGPRPSAEGARHCPSGHGGKGEATLLLLKMRSPAGFTPRRWSRVFLLKQVVVGLVPSSAVYLVDPASSHMLVSKIKPCKCQHMPPNG